MALRRWLRMASLSTGPAKLVNTEYQYVCVSSTGTCICVMVMVSDSGITKVCGKMALVTRTWVRASVIGRSAVRRMPNGMGWVVILGWSNSRMTLVMGQRSPLMSPALAPRNCLP